MKKYAKRIEITATGLVVASIYDDDGNCKGLNFFSSFFRTPSRIEDCAKKAHAWADSMIVVCQRQECANDPL